MHSQKFEFEKIKQRLIEKLEVFTALVDLKAELIYFCPLLVSKLDVKEVLPLDNFFEYLPFVNPEEFKAMLRTKASFDLQLELVGDDYQTLFCKSWGELNEDSTYSISFVELPEENYNSNLKQADSKERYRQLRKELGDLNLIVQEIDKKTDGKFGQAYFASVVNGLSMALKADYVFMGSVDPEQRECTSLYLSYEGVQQENFSYLLKDTPCESVAKGEVCLFGQDIQTLYPNDLLLQEMDIEAYAGVPVGIRVRKDAKIYILVALFKQKLDNPVFYRHVLKVLSRKIETEAERSYLLEQLKVKEERFRKLTENSTDIIYKIKFTPNWHFDYISPAVKEVTGYSPEDFYENNALLKKLIHTDDFQQFFKTSRSEETVPYTFRWVSKMGEVVWIEHKNVYLRDSNGSLIAIEGSARDVSERVKEQVQIKRYSDRLKAAEQLGKMGAWEWDLLQNKVWWSDNHFRLLGEEPQSFTPTIEKFLEYVHPEDLESLQIVIQKTLEEYDTFAEYFRTIDKKGNIKLVFAQSHIERNEAGEATRWSGIQIDMTDLHEKKQALEEKKKLEKVLLDTMAEGVAIYDENLKPVVANKQAYQILQLDIDQFYGKSLYNEGWKIIDTFGNELKHEDFPVYRTFKNKEVIDDFIMGVKTSEESPTIWIKVKTNLIQMHNDDGVLKDFVVVSYADISDMIAFKRTESWYTTAISSMNEGLVIHDKQGKIINFNQAACNLLGLTADQLLGKSSIDSEWQCFRENGEVFPGEEHPAIQTIKTGQFFNNVMMEVRTPEGQSIKIAINSAPIYFSDKSEEPDGAVATFTDITEKKESEIALIKTQELLAETSEVAQVGGWEIDLIQEELIWSDVTRKLHEVPDDYSPTLDEAISFYKEGESQELIQTAFIQGMETGEPYTVEAEFITYKGKEIWVRAIGQSEFKNGECIRMYGTFQDISEKKRLELELKKANEAEFAKLYNKQKEISEELVEKSKELNRFFELSSDLILIANQDTKPLRVNPAYYNILGCTHQEALKFSIDHWVHPEDQEELKKLRKNIENLGFTHFVARLKPKNNKTLWVDWNIAVDPDTKMRYAIGRDITEIKKLEQDLFQAKEEALESAKIKESFLANMSHEIRTPMNAILGFSDLLLRDLEDKLLMDYAEAIHLSSENLLVVINDILDLSKIESGKMVFEFVPFQLDKMLDSVVLTLKQLIEVKGLDFSLKIEENVKRKLMGAPKRITQVLLNLIGNAIKFTSEGFINVKVAKIEKNGATFLQFQVQDSGIGIPENQTSSVFESFTQVTNLKNRIVKGTGLGLAISKKLVELMGGQIFVYSTLGEGSSFYFTIPYKAVDHRMQEINEIDEKLEMPEKCELLLVEDYKLNQRLASKYISMIGYSCDIANNGQEALDMIAEKTYDLILMDIRMPVLDGIETTRRLIAMGCDIPIVALTAHALEKEKERCLKMGMSYYLTKPFNKKDLEFVISRFGGKKANDHE